MSKYFFSTLIFFYYYLTLVIFPLEMIQINSCQYYLSIGSEKKVRVEENKQILTHTNLALVQIALGYKFRWMLDCHYIGAYLEKVASCLNKVEIQVSRVVGRSVNLEGGVGKVFILNLLLFLSECLMIPDGWNCSCTGNENHYKINISTTYYINFFRFKILVS